MAYCFTTASDFDNIWMPGAPTLASMILRHLGLWTGAQAVVQLIVWLPFCLSYPSPKLVSENDFFRKTLADINRLELGRRMFSSFLFLAN